MVELVLDAQEDKLHQSLVFAAAADQVKLPLMERDVLKFHALPDRLELETFALTAHSTPDQSTTSVNHAQLVKSLHQKECALLAHQDK